MANGDVTGWRKLPRWRKRQREPGSSAAMSVKVGAFDVRKIGIARIDWRDPYHVALSVSWPRFFAAMLAVELILNSAFACLYLLQPGDIANTRPGMFRDVFFFSLETLATVGYGVMAPATLYGHIVSAVEILTGVALTAVLTGLVFGRFSKPKAKILYADSAVICRSGGQRALMLRVANGRQTAMSNAQAQLTALLMETTPEGVRFRRPHDLRLVRAQFPLFALTWTLIHQIDETSPLHGATAQTLAAHQIRLFINIRAWDVALATEVHDIHGYTHDAIRIGMRYQDALSWDDAGRTIADIGKLSLLEPDKTPETAQRGPGRGPEAARERNDENAPEPAGPTPGP